MLMTGKIRSNADKNTNESNKTFFPLMMFDRRDVAKRRAQACFHELFVIKPPKNLLIFNFFLYSGFTSEDFKNRKSPNNHLLFLWDVQSQFGFSRTL